MDTVIGGAVVRRRGWPVPFIDDRISLRRGADWIGQDIDAQTVDHYEAWRFDQDGEFSHLRAVSAEWRERNDATTVPEGFVAVIEVWEILFYLTEIFELAGRLGLETAKGSSVTMDVELNLRAGTALVSDFRGRVPLVPRPAPESLPKLTITVPTEKLVTDFGPLAAEMALKIFERFGWSPSLQALQDLQRELNA